MMLRLRIAYTGLLLILAVLLVFVVFRPMAKGEEYSEIQRASLLQADGSYIVQFDILNRENRDMNYVINVLVDGRPYVETVLIRAGGVFTYIHHINRDRAGDGSVSLAIYKDGEASPFEETTYYLK